MIFLRRDVGTCEGGAHVIPVPPGMTPEEAWAEICTLGHLADPPETDEDCEWAVIKCAGGADCECLGGELAPGYEKWVDDRLVFKAPE